VSSLTSSTSIFLSYPPGPKKKTSVVDPNSVPSITDLDGWTAKLLKKQKWAPQTYIADVWPVLMKIPYGKPSAKTSIRHTFDNNKVRSIIDQAILFRYPIYTIIQRLVSASGTVNVFSRSYAQQALDAALEVVATSSEPNHCSTTSVYTVVYERSINRCIPHLSSVRLTHAKVLIAYRIDAAMSPASRPK
jgi:hypothetical protein